MALLEIDNLGVEFETRGGRFAAVSDINLRLDEGGMLGVVGESGSGKSVTMLALMGLLPWNATVSADRLAFGERDFLTLSPRARRQVTGKEVAMVFQEPATSLNPSFTVRYQIAEALKVHEGGGRRQLRERTLELLDQVGIPAPAKRLNAFPHQLSGGMNQRVMIAMAIACNPRLLIADEPTTALDVTIQAQILDLLLRLQQERGMAMILITHDMGVVAETAREVAVMYAGQIVETGATRDVFNQPRHPYTAALLNALPEKHPGHDRLPTIPGLVPGIEDRPEGCLYNPRCERVRDHCRQVRPALEPDAAGRVRCFYPLVDTRRNTGSGTR